MDGDYKAAQTELLKEGMATYIEVKQAVQLFEELVGESCKKLMMQHKDKASRLFDREQLTDTDIGINAIDGRLSRVNVGASLGHPETWGVRWGIRWLGDNNQGLKAFACISVRVSATYKREHLHKALVDASNVLSDDSIKIGTTPEWEYEVWVQKPLITPDVFDSVEDALDKVLVAFLDLLEKAGGLRAAILGKTETPEN